MGRAYGTSIVDRALARFGGSSRVLFLAIRNVTRNRLRVALTLVLLAAGGVFYMSALNVRQSMIGMLDRLFETRRADLTVSLASDYPIDAVERAARSIPGVSAAEGWTVVDGEIPRPSNDAGEAHAATRKTFAIVAVPPGSRLIALDILDGQGLDGGTRGLVVNRALFDKLGRPALDGEVRLQVEGENSSFKLLGVAREPFSPPTAYVARAYLDGRPRAATANNLRIALANADYESIDATSADVDTALEREGIRALQTSTKADNRNVLDQHMVMIYVFLLVVSCILGVVGALGLVTAVSLNVTERRREMGVLRAIGATPARVALIVVLEAMTVGAIAWLFATLTSGPLGKAIGELLLGLMFRTETDIPMRIEPTGVIIWLAVSLAGSALASLWPAWQASRASVREALTYE